MLFAVLTRQSLKPPPYISPQSRLAAAEVHLRGGGEIHPTVTVCVIFTHHFPPVTLLTQLEIYTSASYFSRFHNGRLLLGVRFRKTIFMENGRKNEYLKRTVRLYLFWSTIDGQVHPDGMYKISGS